jgi:hypothetical protein
MLVALVDVQFSIWNKLILRKTVGTFRCFKSRSSTHRLSFFILRFSQAEISNLNFELLIQENILRFQISMHYLVVMHTNHAHEHLREYLKSFFPILSLDLLLSQIPGPLPLFFEPDLQVLSLAELHLNVQIQTKSAFVFLLHFDERVA